MRHILWLVCVMMLVIGCGSPSLTVPEKLSGQAPPRFIEDTAPTVDSDGRESNSIDGLSNTTDTTASSPSPTADLTLVQAKPSPVASSEVADVPSASGIDSDVSTNSEGSNADIPEVTINEVLYDLPGSDGTGSLFIELRGPVNADLSGMEIRLINGDGGKLTQSIVLPTGARIGESGLFVIADQSSGIEKNTMVVNANAIIDFDPQNGPDSVQLLGANGILLDVLGYGSPLPALDAEGIAMFEKNPAPDAPAGSSLSRLPDAADNDDNSIDFVINETPSPGDKEVIVP